ncbi:MAG: hypothetical protein ACPGTU_05270 [Myxococcota bacterium]
MRKTEPAPPTAAQWVDRLERRVRSVAERSMRVAVLREMLGELDAEHAMSALGLLHDRARAGHAHARLVFQEMALERDLFLAMPYPVRSVAYTRARKAGRDEVARMLLIGGKKTNPTVAEASTDNDYASESVGQRCTDARGRDRFKLDRLLHDRDYRVVRVLLNNPIVVERDVVKVAAMRPTRPEVLTEIARHRKWASRYAVRKALSSNPHTPPSVARRLIPTLMRQDLAAVAEAGSIPAEIRELAQSLLNQA